MGKKLSEVCVAVRQSFLEVIPRIFGGELANACLEDLPQVWNFREHAKTCSDCAKLGEHLAKAIWVKFNARQ